ncbi:MAG: hypothetical protein GXP42_11540, partial [Chloroflexi bacterium]|nr:hypothetical protein [Chloroflexota bacterium]
MKNKATFLWLFAATLLVMAIFGFAATGANAAPVEPPGFRIPAEMAAPAAVLSAPTVDGLYSGDESNYYVLGSADNGRGTLYYNRVGNTLYLLMRVDPSVNDNVFGEKGVDDAYVQSVGWAARHTFKDLWKSDHIALSAQCGSQTWTWAQDYLYDADNDGDPLEADWLSDPYGNDGDATSVPPGLTAASSLMWNLNWNIQNSGWDITLGGARGSGNKPEQEYKSPYVNNGGSETAPAYSGFLDDGTSKWEWAMVYEMSFDVSACGNNDIIVGVTSAHNSPSKDGDEDVPVTPTPVPSPPPANAAHIGDYVWYDADEDGVQDAGEAPVPGVRVELYDSSDALQASDTTDINGQYGFDVAAGDYYVKFILPPGHLFTLRDQGGDDALDSDPDRTTGKTALFTVAANEIKNDVDAGLIRNPDVCYGVADSTTTVNDGAQLDTLAYLDRLTGATAAVGGAVGNTGVNNIEAIAVEPGGGALYAADAGQLGTLNLITGAFTPIGSGFGTGNGSLGSITFYDVDSLTFDPTTGILYGAHRRSGNDVLFQIDPATGAYVPNAFGPGIDYVPVQKINNLPDVDDIAVDPVTGEMYASINDGGSSENHLVIIDKATGNVTDIGVIKDSGGNNIQDIEGLAFFNDGNLYGSSGKNGPTTNALYLIDKNTAVATLVGQFTEPLRDFEGLGCLTANAAIVVEKSTNGEDADDPPGPTINVGDPVNWTYFVRNTGNIALINVQVTDDQGVSIACPGGQPFTLQPGESKTCTGSGLAIAGQYANVATVTGESITSGVVVSDTDPSHYNGVNLNTASIGDYVWHDLYFSQTHLVDGIQDAGEPGIENVVVELYDSTNTLIYTDTTDANGYYLFENLAAGVYTVKIADSNFASGGVLEGWYASPKDRGGDDAKDSDGDETTHTATVVLGQGEAKDDVDFGFFRTCVSLEKTGPASVNKGDDIVYNFRVENCGDVVLHGGVSVYDPLINPSGDNEIWNEVVWPGEVYTFTRTYTPDANQCGDVTNTATAVGHPKHPDGYYLDNISVESSWTVNINCNQPDLLVDKTIKTPNNRTTFIVGEQVSFEVVTTNTGNTTISYLPLEDQFDNVCLTYSAKSSQPNENSYNNSSGVINWLDLTLSNGQDLPPGESFTTTITFDVTGVSAYGFNTALVSGAQDEFGTVIPDRSDTVEFICANARIRITPDADANQVGDAHTFTVKVEKNVGGGWVPVQGVNPAISPTPNSVTDNCASNGTDANGQCTVEINSDSTGEFTAHAEVNFTIGGAAVHRETDGMGGNSDDAVKRYVDAKLTLTPPQATNQVGDAHVFTAELKFDYGDGQGFVAAPA